MHTENNHTATKLEIYPGPGVEGYRSDLYAVNIHNGSDWQPAYLYKVARLATPPGWHRGKHPSVNFTTFGTGGPVRVRLTRSAGVIESIEISPKSKRIPADVIDGAAILTLNPLDKVWITIKGVAVGLTFRNITLEKRQNLEERKSRLFGKDEENDIRDVTFENLTIDGIPVTEANRDRYFEINAFARDIRFTSPSRNVASGFVCGS